ncbi:MAG: thiol:disulfide interchange protein DsbA/DsbL [Nitrosomonas sp.]|nr:thiol:disulfide interchange protein DsbA/DsbL [Nitrosomonas sp.]
MNIQRIAHLLLSILFLGLLSSATQAQMVEGKDYIRLATQQPTEDKEKIEVIEFFWYGCPHCNDLHPHLKNWLENKPEDVNFRYVPAIFRANWMPAAKTFYAMESLDLTKQLNDKLYHAIHRDKIDLSKEPTLFAWIEKQGIERSKFVNAYNSFTVQNQASRAAQMTKQYQVTGVPALVVNGTYLTSGRLSGTPQDTITVLNYLLDKVRQEQK